MNRRKFLSAIAIAPVVGAGAVAAMAGPTQVFPFASGGLGILGERDLETVMPLSRNQHGKLGVVARSVKKLRSGWVCDTARDRADRIMIPRHRWEIEQYSNGYVSVSAATRWGYRDYLRFHISELPNEYVTASELARLNKAGWGPKKIRTDDYRRLIAKEYGAEAA